MFQGNGIYCKEAFWSTAYRNIAESRTRTMKCKHLGKLVEQHTSVSTIISPTHAVRCSDIKIRWWESKSASRTGPRSYIRLNKPLISHHLANPNPSKDFSAFTLLPPSQRSLHLPLYFCDQQLRAQLPEERGAR